MKKLLFRKILLDCTIFFLVSLISASIIIWVVQAVNYLDIMIDDGRNYITYFKYTLLSFPKIVSKIVPFALFFSFTFVIIRYETNNELMILWNFGVNKIQLVNFFFFISVIIVLIQILLTSFLVPKSQETARSLIRTSEIDFLESFIKPKKFNDLIKGMTIYVEKKDKDGNLENIYLKRKDNSGNFQITFAKKGLFSYQNNNQSLILFEGQTLNGKNDNFTNFSFSRTDLVLNNLQTKTIITIKTQETSTKNIIRCIKTLSSTNQSKINKDKIFFQNCSLKLSSNNFKELYKRFIIPLYIPVLMLVSFLLIITSKENRKYTYYKNVIFIIGFLVIVYSETTLRLVEDSLDKNIKLIIVPIFLTAMLYSILLYQFKIKKN